VVYRVRSAGHEGRSPSGGGTPLPGAISPAETGEIRARGEARRSEVDQSILQGMVRFGDVNVADKRCTTSRCSKAIIPRPAALLSARVNTNFAAATARSFPGKRVGPGLSSHNQMSVAAERAEGAEGDWCRDSHGCSIRGSTPWSRSRRAWLRISRAF